MLSKINEVADSVFRLGSRHVNWYVVVDDQSVTVVDSGLPRQWTQLTDLLGAIGRSLSDIEAVLLTHADPDHLGNAERLSTEGAATVMVHEADVPAATRQVRIPPPKVALWRPQVLAALFHTISNGLLKWPTIASPGVIDPSTRLDVPGRPIAIHTPGHTPGSTCFAFDERDVIFVGDVLFNTDPNTGRTGPIVSPKGLSTDHVAAAISLSQIEGLNHRTVLFGHGDPFYQGIREVVRQARSHGKGER